MLALEGTPGSILCTQALNQKWELAGPARMDLIQRGQNSRSVLGRRGCKGPETLRAGKEVSAPSVDSMGAQAVRQKQKQALSPGDPRPAICSALQRPRAGQGGLGAPGEGEDLPD